MYKTQLKRVYPQFQSISYGRVKIVSKQIPSHFRCIAHGTSRHRYETHSMVYIKYGAERFTQKFQVLVDGDLNQHLTL
jgi:hypothetical protein